MLGLMMETPLLTSSLMAYAATYHGDTEIVSRSVEGPLHRYSYRDAHARVARLAQALLALGIRPGDRVATLAWNGYRHFELYFAISGIGAVCHTVNPRLFDDQIAFILNHAKDRVIFTDLTFVPLLERLRARLDGVEATVVMTDPANMPDSSLDNLLCYETLLEAEDGDCDWPVLDENQASSLCYTSGTTGNPRGTLYSHRATVLHAFSSCTVDHPLSLGSWDTVLPVVPMFHVHAWGIPYAAPMCGAKLVLPGPRLDGESLYDLLESEQVSITAGVPTVWLGLLAYLEQSGKRLGQLRDLIVGGAAAPLSMIKAFQEDHGITVVHAWGMTEMSPVGTTGRLKKKYRDLPAEQRHAIQVRQGRAIYGVEMKIADEEGKALPHDGSSAGELLVRGPWIASAYYEDPDATAAAFHDDGWFATGDMANIDPDGHMQITDRSKDLIKSGGEWISSIALENAAIGHDAVAEAAAIAAQHPKWGERPLLVVVRREGADATAEELLAFLKRKVVKWWLPDDVVFVDELPHTATGKINKLKLRQMFAGHRLPTAAS